MKERKLNYKFHNPNSAAATADYLLKILIQSNAKKVEEAIQKAATQEKINNLDDDRLVI